MLVIDAFNKKYTKTINKIKVQRINFFWEFCGFFEIINLNNLVTFIEAKLKIKYTKKQENDLSTKISELRDLLDQNIVNTKVLNINLITNYLIKMYASIRDFIDQILFTMYFITTCIQMSFITSTYMMLMSFTKYFLWN